MPSVLAVVPARFRSTRFPGKVLAPLGNRTLLDCVWRRVTDATRIDRVGIATDDARVESTARAFGAEVFMTSDRHATGTDRIGEVVQRLDADGFRCDAIVNVQGDEPFVTGTSLDRLVDALFATEADIATLVEPLTRKEALFDPNVVKAVAGRDGRALYFSRSPIPYYRGAATQLSHDFGAALDEAGWSNYRQHQGIYAYRRDAFDRFVALEPTPLERAEGLEQLRALENGLSIQIVESDFRSIGVDTPDDLERAREAMEVL